jgi:hypothetical protein
LDLIKLIKLMSICTSNFGGKITQSVDAKFDVDNHCHLLLTLWFAGNLSAAIDPPTPLYP